MSRKDIPNIISVIRILLVMPVVYLIVLRNYPAALSLFVIAGVSDGIDGFLARHFNWRSALGAMLDPIADKLLLVCSFLALGGADLIDDWLVAAVILRDLIIVVGAVLYHYWFEPFRGEPLFIGKACTFIQILLIVVVLVDAGVQTLPDASVYAVNAAAMVITLLSGASYIFLWSKRAWQHHARGTGRRQSHKES